MRALSRSHTNQLPQILATSPDDVRKFFTTNIQAVPAGPSGVTSATLLSTLTGGSGFQPGHISITDGFGAAFDINLTSVNNVGDIMTRINAATSGTVIANINNSGTGLALTQVGGSGTPTIAEVGGGTTAASLGLNGTFSAGLLNGFFQAITPVN